MAEKKKPGFFKRLGRFFRELKAHQQTAEGRYQRS